MEEIQTTGSQLKYRLGLEKLPFVFIQKVLNIGIPIYIVTFDSRYYTHYLNRNRIKKASITSLQQVQTLSNDFKTDELLLSQPILIEHYAAYIKNSAFVFTQDLCGLNYQNKSLLESKIKKIIQKGRTMERYKRKYAESLSNDELNLIIKELENKSKDFLHHNPLIKKELENAYDEKFDDLEGQFKIKMISSDSFKITMPYDVTIDDKAMIKYLTETINNMTFKTAKITVKFVTERSDYNYGQADEVYYFFKILKYELIF